MIAAIAPAASFANITSNGGPVAIKPHIYPIFWGNAWNSGTPATERSKILNFYNALNESTGSAWQGILTQYWGPTSDPLNVSEKTSFGFISRSVVVGGSYTDTAGPPSGATRANIKAEVEKAVAFKNGQESWPKTLAAATADDQFVVVTPPGTTFATEIPSTSCGEHFSGTTSGSNYGIARVSWEFENALKEKLLCSETVTAGHEYAEAATDPLVDAWTGSGSAPEVADRCGSFERATWAGGIEVPALWDLHKGTEGECTTADGSPLKKRQLC